MKTAHLAEQKQHILIPSINEEIEPPIRRLIMHCTSACKLFSPENPRDWKDGFPKGRTCCRKKRSWKEDGESPGRRKVPGSRVKYWTLERCMLLNIRECPKTLTGDIQDRYGEQLQSRNWHNLQLPLCGDGKSKPSKPWECNGGRVCKRVCKTIKSCNSSNLFGS